MKSVYDALPFIRARGLRSLAMPNAANWGFDYHTFLVVRRLQKPQRVLGSRLVA